VTGGSTDRRPVLYGALAALCVAVLGGLSTDTGPWYRNLVKPVWTPPDLLFGPAWTLIYALCVISFAEVWRSAADAAGRRRAVVLFLVNGVVNLLWSVVFFAMRRPDLALLVVAALWLSVAGLVMRYSRPPRRRPGLLLLPYLAWVTFAAALNLAVVRLNPPFGA
jgi:tryptophan-rich sensory protein